MKPIVDLVAGARPNFVKLAPVHRALSEAGRLDVRTVHTGQHYDRAMSRVFFDQLGIPEPDIYLKVGSGTHGQQTARILERYEAHLLASRPAAAVVFGDVNSTVACSLAAVKLEVPVAHVEAGLRSFDRTMPEEINRILTDTVADLLLVTEKSGVENLEREGVGEQKIRLVGNVMIDSLRTMLSHARSLDAPGVLGLEPGRYGLVTLHRPANVDEPDTLAKLVGLLRELADELPLVFPVHPRTAAAAEQAGILGAAASTGEGLMVIEPQPYVSFLGLMADAKVVLTDSGGIQEETTALDIPCLTLRDNTERPVTLELGTSRLVGNDPAKIRQAFAEVLAGAWPRASPIPLWDGRAGLRVARELAAWLLD